MGRKHTVLFRCDICPKKPVPKFKNPQLFSGSGNNPTSLLSPGMAYSVKLNKALIGRHGWKPTIVHQPTNEFKQRAGSPGGSQFPPKNLF